MHLFNNLAYHTSLFFNFAFCFSSNFFFLPNTEQNFLIIHEK